jgi:RNA-binding protein NOB1
MDNNTTPADTPSISNNIDTKINHLVIDTNAIINGMTLKDTADFFYTCPEVMAELRSAHSREYLTRLPFEIKVENPTEDSLKAGKKILKDFCILLYFFCIDWSSLSLFSHQFCKEDW